MFDTVRAVLTDVESVHLVCLVCVAPLTPVTGPMTLLCSPGQNIPSRTDEGQIISIIFSLLFLSPNDSPQEAVWPYQQLG